MGTLANSTEQLFLDYLSGLDSDESFDIAELQRLHPDKAQHLRALYDDWKRLRPLLAGASSEKSVHASLDERFGLGADPTISLAESSDERAQDAKTLLDTLSMRVSSKSRYRLVGEIARGGMGVILKVWDGDLRRHLAMKVILGKSREGAGNEAPPTDARVISRFLEEAQVTGQLDHPAIVPVHELGLSQDGRVYFTMRLVRGRELSQIHELAWNGAEGWNQTRALGVLLRACEAIAFAHAKGVVHRDLKPANVMVGRFGEVYVMDWGLARVVGSPDRHDIRLDVDPAKLSGVITDRSETPASDSPLKTMDGDIIGTPAFMAPEQALGHLAQIGPHSDVYSLGSMLYHLLARTPPHVLPGEKATGRDVLTRLMAGPPEPLSKLAPKAPGELISICEKAMARMPEQRYSSVQELAEDLRAFLENRVVRAYRTGPIVELRKWMRRNRGLAASLAALVLLALGGAITIAVVQLKANHKIRLASAETERINQEFVAVTGGLAEARAQLAAAASDSEAKLAQLQQLTVELEESRRELTENHSARQKLEQDNNQLKVDFRETYARLGERKQELDRAQDELTKLKRQTDSLAQERAQLQEALRLLKEEQKAQGLPKKDGG